MNKQDRWNEILLFVNARNEATVQQIADAFAISVATVRRDLQEMEDQGLLDRYHGGARSNSASLSEPPMTLKSGANQQSKNIVGRYAAVLIKDNQMVYIDAGSTTYEMLDYITAKNITVVTIGIPHITKLVNRGINAFVLGGSVRKSTMAITGAKTLSQLDDYFFDVSFIGTNGIHDKAGLTTTNEFEALIKEKAINRSRKTYCLADHTKFNVIYPCSYTTTDDVTVITDTIGDYEGKLKDVIEVQKLWKL